MAELTETDIFDRSLNVTCFCDCGHQLFSTKSGCGTMFCRFCARKHWYYVDDGLIVRVVLPVGSLPPAQGRMIANLSAERYPGLRLRGKTPKASRKPTKENPVSVPGSITQYPSLRKET